MIMILAVVIIAILTTEWFDQAVLGAGKSRRRKRGFSPYRWCVLGITLSPDTDAHFNDLLPPYEGHDCYNVTKSINYLDMSY